MSKKHQNSDNKSLLEPNLKFESNFDSNLSFEDYDDRLGSGMS